MSEYWKSTPKYWCKFCKTYVRDTTTEKKQHDSTPRHQNNIQRSLRDLHKGQERDERDKQRAKDEVARLNGLVGPKPVGLAAIGAASKLVPSIPATKATPDERRRQMEQLAAMGIAIPQEYRKEMNIASEWSTVSETPIYSKAVKEEGEPATGAFGVRKRKMEDEEDEEKDGAVAAPSRKNWGSTLKSYPGATTTDNADLDSLLSAALVKTENIKSETGVKQEDLPEEAAPSLAAVPGVDEPAAPVKKEPGAELPAVVFKKRKGVKR